MALLHILNKLAPHFGFILHAATFDHQLRGAESAGDVQFVEQVCHEWGITVTSGRADVSKLAHQKQVGIETAARLARYDFLAETAYNAGANTIAVAHHADDQAETVLMHLLRGAGTHGLAGMTLRSPVPGHTDLSLIRPLLQVSRAEIETYCEQHQIAYRYDSSNADTSILRNAIRLNVLPELARYTPQVRSTLARIAEIAAVEDDYLQQHVLRFTQSDAVTISTRRIAINRNAFGELHGALQRRVLIWAVTQAGMSEDLSANLIVDAIEIAKRGQQGAIALLGNGFRLRVEYTLLVIESENNQVVNQNFPLIPQGYELDIQLPSVNILAGWTLKATLTQPTAGSFCKLSLPNGSHVVLRTREDGDIFSPLGMKGHTQKLSRWMVNRKIPKTIRDQIPLFVIDGAIAAIVVNNEWFISEKFAVRNNDEPIIYFQFLENS